ncbi:MAG: hypothetical protein R3E79_25350 [Caldilineaceae bacterium]
MAPQGAPCFASTCRASYDLPWWFTSYYSLADFATGNPPIALLSSMTGKPATVAGEWGKCVRGTGHSGSPASSNG